jgi:hypothetical protein
VQSGATSFFDSTPFDVELLAPTLGLSMLCVPPAL